MESFTQLLERNVGSSELDADDFNFGSPPEEQLIAEASPPVKGSSNKKRTKNFSEKDNLLVAAWLEISMDPIQAIDQTRGTYWQRIHDYYHKHKDFDSDRNLNSLSYRWGIIQASVSKFCSCLSQVMLAHPSGLTEQDKIQKACAMYKDGDQYNRSFTLLHCWNVLQHAQKWKDLPCNNINNNKKQKTSSNATPRSCTAGTNESHHDVEDGPSQTSPRKGGRPDGQKKEKQKRGKNAKSHGDTLYMDAMEISWGKREKAEELKEIKKKERNDCRLALETRRIELKQDVENRKLQLQEDVENRKLDLQQKKLELKQRKDDEKIMNMDLSSMSKRQQLFYSNLQDEIIARYNVEKN